MMMSGTGPECQALPLAPLDQAVFAAVFYK
jgi:hypothetical protein